MRESITIAPIRLCRMRIRFIFISLVLVFSLVGVEPASAAPMSVVGVGNSASADFYAVGDAIGVMPTPDPKPIVKPTPKPTVKPIVPPKPPENPTSINIAFIVLFLMFLLTLGSSNVKPAPPAPPAPPDGSPPDSAAPKPSARPRR